MKVKYYYILLMFGFSLAIVSSLHPSNFERTKAEDIDDSYYKDIFNVSYSCDLTFQFCDINCCSDQDCSEQEKQSFQCSNKEYEVKSKFSYLNCENLGSMNSIGNPLMCLYDQNSPYLGDFYEEDVNFSSFTFSEILSTRKKEISSFKITDSLNISHEKKYKHGSDIFFLDIEGQYNNINIFLNVLSKENGYCSKVPIRFLIDEKSNCFFLMDEEQCLLNEELHLQHHLNSLKKIELLGDINGFNVTYSIVCLKDETGFVYFHKPVFQEYSYKNTELFDLIECESYAITELNNNKTICKNVVVGVNYTFFVLGTVLKRLEVSIFTANIPFNKRQNMDMGLLKPINNTNGNIVHTLQKTTVKFEDLANNAKKHGYILGNPMNRIN